LNLQRQSPHDTVLDCALAKLGFSDVMVGVQPDCQTSLPPARDPSGSPAAPARPRPNSVAHRPLARFEARQGALRLRARNSERTSGRLTAAGHTATPAFLTTVCRSYHIIQPDARGSSSLHPFPEGRAGEGSLCGDPFPR
jgi:hypothetical protein